MVYLYEGWAEQWRNIADHSSSAQSVATVPVASAQEGSWVAAAGEGANNTYRSFDLYDSRMCLSFS